YRGVVKEKPLLGDRLRSITPTVIHQALQLTRTVVLLWLAPILLVGMLAWVL
ncbi:MAG: cobalamin biosynthesis protein, partial [Leptolyngbyaceae cyanobacterium SL_7_1]|nr:cobalamin biosynthesis protein [Leptolyngbyaceae cyanobacterium SL_7_1]